MKYILEASAQFALSKEKEEEEEEEEQDTERMMRMGLVLLHHQTRSHCLNYC